MGYETRSLQGQACSSVSPSVGLSAPRRWVPALYVKSRVPSVSVPCAVPCMCCLWCCCCYSPRCLVPLQFATERELDFGRGSSSCCRLHISAEAVFGEVRHGKDRSQRRVCSSAMGQASMTYVRICVK